MASRKGATSTGRAQRFGGDWTSSKLAILGEYLKSYTTTLKNQPFRTAYIDAFAGTGYRMLEGEGDLLPDSGPSIPS